MAIGIYRSLTFGGIDSADYGVYITGEAVYNSPARSVETVNVPGRNGAVLLDNGYFENIEVSYPAGIPGTDQSDFATKISNFRNAILSQVGYQRLTDEYNPDEYRMATYISGLEVQAVEGQQGTAGEFELVFNCKPQRFLTSGETAVTVGGQGGTETETGDLVEIENPDGNIAVQSLSVLLVATQSGSGTPSPDNIRPISGYDTVDVIVSPTTSALDGQTYTTTLPETVYGGTLNVITGELILNMGSVDLGTLTWSSQSSPSQYSYYSNALSDIKKPVDTVSLGNYLCEQYSETVSGSFISRGNNKYCVSQGSRINVNDNRYDNEASFKTAMNGVKLVYELITPRTIQLTPEDIDLLLGTNNVWSDGTITVEYAQDFSRLYNPTLFESEPLLEVEGYGTIEFNGYNIEIANGDIGLVVFWYGEYKIGKSGTITKQVPIEMFNPTDTFTFNVYDMVTLFEENPTISNTNVDVSNNQYINNDGSVSYTTDLSGTFAIGTSGTVTNTSTYTFTGSKTVVIDMSVAYDATDGTLTYALDITTTGNPDWSYDNLNTFGIDKCAATSTASRLGNPTYIDCDLGECYKYENDELISLNAYIDLGSDLPKLAPGANEFNTDNTITDLKVVPRWWKI